MTDTARSERIRRAVVVAGAASGIGLATTHMLTRAGTSVVGVDLAELPAELRGADDLQWVCGDIASQDTWIRVLSVLRDREPLEDISLISCAADIVVAPFLETTLEDWRRLYEVNVLGVIRGMQALMPAMLERRQGSIAVTCSVNSLYAESTLSAYSTSKAALLHVVRSAALEYAQKGLRINAVCPGAVDTPLLRRALNVLPDPAEARRIIERRTPTGKILQPREVAAVLCFLITDAASGISGAAVTVDGGLTTAYDFDSSPTTQ
jgi:NAD(P)-dependent dehydrogenase (short-subunit alcohol dehydrogenase family)